MNGLKYIRTKCNYSQRSLAEALGVSRQAINMWENSKKLPSRERKEDLCCIFGIDNPDCFGELTAEQRKEIDELPMYKLSFGGDSERFAFKPINPNDRVYNLKHLTNANEPLSLDEKCKLRRLELKALLDDISNYAVEKDIKNSIDNLTALNRTLRIFEGIFDAAKEARGKHPEYVMVYIYTIMAVLGAMNISFGNIDEDDVMNRETIEGPHREWYDYREFTVELSKYITEHLDNICNDMPTNRENPHGNYRRRIKKA